MQTPWDLLKRIIDNDTFSLLEKQEKVEQRKSSPEKITQKQLFEKPKIVCFRVILQMIAPLRMPVGRFPSLPSGTSPAKRLRHDAVTPQKSARKVQDD